MENNCRTCFGQYKGLCSLEELAILEDTVEMSYAELLKEVASINAVDDKIQKGMPRYLCSCCSSKLKTSYAFIKQAQEVNKKLWTLLTPIPGKNNILDSVNDVPEGFEIKIEQEEIYDEMENMQDMSAATKFEKLSDGRETVKLEPTPPTDVQGGVHIKMEFSESCYPTDNIQVKDEPTSTYDDVADTDYMEDQSDIDSSQGSLDSSEDEIEDDKDFPYIDESSQTKHAINRKNHSQKAEMAQLHIDSDIAVPCTQCNKIFANSKKLSQHLRNAHVPDDQKCVCPICGAKYARTWNMYYHMKAAHGPDTVKKLLPTKDRKHECEQCHRKYTHKRHLIDHINVKHNKEAEQIVPPLLESNVVAKKPPKVRPLCFICGASFSNRGHLNIHMRRHTGEYPFKCEFCDKGFPRVSELTYHRRLHTGEKPFECETCGKTFRDSTRLANHKRSHSDQRPHQCTQCGRSFKCLRDLNKHKKIHSGERPYSCNVCGTRFTQSSSLKTHRMNLGHMEDSI